MKELSIEEKSKRYDEALDEAKAIHKAIRQDLKSVIEQIFPEVKESEDEKIKEWNFDKKELKKIEQTPVWTKEDDKKRTLLIRNLEVNHPNGYFKVNPADTLNMEAIHTEELVSWLKSLKSRIKGE